MENLRSRLKEVIIKNKRDLLTNSLVLLNNKEANALYKRVFYDLEWNDKYDLIKVLKNTLSSDANPRFIRDELFFHIKGIYDINVNQERDIISQQFNLYEIKYETEYWKVQKNVSKFDKIRLKDCFENIILNEKEVHSYVKKRMMLFNVKDWVDYFQKITSSMLKTSFFDKQLSTAKTTRFSKKINDEYKLVIEYDKQHLKKKIHQGLLTEPEYCLLIVNKNFDKKTKSYLYKTQVHPDVIYLRNVFHPVFRGVSSIGGFSSRLNSIQNKDGSYSFCYPTQYKQLGNNQIQLFNSEEYGNLLIKHALYSLDFKFFFAQTYLEYIENSLKEALQTT